MQALILAAGKGSRLGKYTKENTKCMLLINNKPLILYTLENLNNQGIKKLIMVVGYKKENLMNFLGNQYKNIKIEYIINDMYDTTNNIYSLYLAKDKLIQDDTILIESDLIFEEKILKKILNNPYANLVAVAKYQIWMDGTSVTLDENDNIIGFHSKHDFDFSNVENYYKTINIYKFSKKFSKNVYIPFLEAYLKAVGVDEYYETVIKVIASIDGIGLKAIRLNEEKWYEIDHAEDKANAEILFATDPETKFKLIKNRYGGYWRFPRLKDFCYLVNPYFPTKKMIDEMKAYHYNLLSQYPSGIKTQQLLAGKMFEIEPENIIVANGASEIIKNLSNVLDGTFGLVFPTFDEYPNSIGDDKIIKYFPKNKDFKYGKSDLLNLAKKCDNLLLINPDNPSGNFISKEDLLDLANQLLKMKKYFILDESFVDFSKGNEKNSLINQKILNKYPNLIIIKSISKSYGIPGIRLGIAASSNKDIIKKIKTNLSIWNINSYAEFFLQIYTKYKKNYIKACEKIADERDRFYKRLCEISYLRPIYSQANYFLVEVIDKYSAKDLAIILLDKYDIYIKDLSNKIGLDREFIRIAVKNYEDNEFLIEKLKMIKK